MKVQTKSEFSELQYLLAHFKNSIHEGLFSQNTNRRDGPGITILDSGSIIIGDYKQDQLHGLSLIYITLQTYFIGQINKGCLDGPFVIRSPSLTVYSEANLNRIDGEVLIINYETKRGQLWSVEGDGQYKINNELSFEDYVYKQEMMSLKKKKAGNEEEKNTIKRRNLFLQQQVLHNLAQYIEKLPDVAGFFMLNKNYVYKTFQQNQILFLQDVRRDPQSFLAVSFNNNQEIIAYGIFTELQTKAKSNYKEKKPSKNKSYEQEYILNGLGYLYIEQKNQFYNQSQIIYQGEFINHRLHGEGCKKLLRANKSIYGQFIHGEIRNMDVIASNNLEDEVEDMAGKLLQKKIKSTHVHSLQFINNYANERPIRNLNNLLNQIRRSQNI